MSCFLLYFSRLVAYDFLYEKILRQRKSRFYSIKKRLSDPFLFMIYSPSQSILSIPRS